MLFRFFLIMILLIIISKEGTAQDVKVKSGNHPEFARLVFYLKEPTAWEIEETPEGFKLFIEDDGVRFDISDVFFFIPRDRIFDLQPSGSSIEILSACGCQARAFQFAPSIIVVDIADPGALAGTKEQAEVRRNGFQGGNSISMLSEKESLFEFDFPAILTGTSYSFFEFSSGIRPIFRLADGDQNKIALTDMFGLAREVGRAASLSLLSKNPSPHLNGVSRPLGQFADVMMRSTRDGGNFVGRVSEFCSYEDHFNVASWSDNEPLEAIRLARDLISSDIDTVPRSNVVLAAQMLAFHGFGAEALQIISGFEVSGDDADALNLVAWVLEGRPEASSNVLKVLEGCADEVVLWKLLASPDGRIGSEHEMRSALREFYRLPAHLRAFLGPSFLKRLWGSGFLSESLGVIDASLAWAEGNHHFDSGDVVAHSYPLGRRDIGFFRSIDPDTFMSLISKELEAAGVDFLETAGITPEDIEFLVRTSMGSAASVDLLRSYTAGLVTAQNFSRAADFLSSFSGSRHAADIPIPEITDELYSGVLAVEDDYKFLSYVVLLREHAETLMPSPEILRDLSSRLSDLGFSQSSRHFLRLSEGAFLGDYIKSRGGETVENGREDVLARPQGQKDIFGSKNISSLENSVRGGSGADGSNLLALPLDKTNNSASSPDVLGAIGNAQESLRAKSFASLPPSPNLEDTLSVTRGFSILSSIRAFRENLSAELDGPSE